MTTEQILDLLESSEPRGVRQRRSPTRSDRPTVERPGGGITQRLASARGGRAGKRRWLTPATAPRGSRHSGNDRRCAHGSRHGGPRRRGCSAGPGWLGDVCDWRGGRNRGSTADAGQRRPELRIRCLAARVGGRDAWSSDCLRPGFVARATRTSFARSRCCEDSADEGFPVPPIVDAIEDETWFGTQAFVMALLPGRPLHMFDPALSCDGRRGGCQRAVGRCRRCDVRAAQRSRTPTDAQRLDADDDRRMTWTGRCWCSSVRTIQRLSPR